MDRLQIIILFIFVTRCNLGYSYSTELPSGTTPITTATTNAPTTTTPTTTTPMTTTCGATTCRTTPILTTAMTTTCVTLCTTTTPTTTTQTTTETTTTIPTTITHTTAPTTTPTTTTPASTTMTPTPTRTTCGTTICTTTTPVTTTSTMTTPTMTTPNTPTPTTTTTMTTTCTNICTTTTPTTTTQTTTKTTTTITPTTTPATTTTTMTTTPATTTPTTTPTTTITTSTTHTTPTTTITTSTTPSTTTTPTTTTPSTTTTPTTTTPSTTTPVDCHYPPPTDCCIRKHMRISLEDNVPVVFGKVPYVSVMEQTNGKDRCGCDAKILLNATFQKNSAFDTCQGCTKVPKCGRKMLRIDLEMAPIKTGFSFHVGDSRSNNGYKGDASTQEKDAEFHSLGYQHLLYGSDKCPNMSMIMTGLLSNSVTKVTIFIGNEFMRVSNNLGYVYELCSECLFSLNGQSDTQGPINEDIFIGLNRIIDSPSYREGTGVCSAVISWACPWDC